MADSNSNDLATRETPQVPDWMKEQEVLGAAQIGQYQNQSRIAMVQPQSGSELKAIAPEGSILLQPDGVVVAEPAEEFTFIPLFFWVTFETHSDIDDAASDYIMASTMDHNSDLAKKARNKATREEKYGPDDKYIQKHNEVLNFAVIIDSGPAKGEGAVLRFFGGEHFTGRKLCGAIKRRGVSIFANRFTLKSKHRQRDRYNWYGFEINNPESGGIIQDREHYEQLTEAHYEFEKALKAGAVGVNYSDGGDRAESGGGSGGGETYDSGDRDDGIPDM